MYYYFGELGFFVDIILGELEKYTKEHPDMGGKITIYSYTNFCKVIENLFPDLYYLIESAILKKLHHFCSIL